MKRKCWYCGGFGYFDLSDYLSQKDLDIGLKYGECPSCKGDRYIKLSLLNFLATWWFGWNWLIDIDRERHRYRKEIEDKFLNKL